MPQTRPPSGDRSPGSENKKQLFDNLIQRMDLDFGFGFGFGLGLLNDAAAPASFGDIESITTANSATAPATAPSTALHAVGSLFAAKHIDKHGQRWLLLESVIDGVNGCSLKFMCSDKGCLKTKIVDLKFFYDGDIQFEGLRFYDFQAENDAAAEAAIAAAEAAPVSFWDSIYTAQSTAPAPDAEVAAIVSIFGRIHVDHNGRMWEFDGSDAEGVERCSVRFKCSGDGRLSKNIALTVSYDDLSHSH